MEAKFKAGDRIRVETDVAFKWCTGIVIRTIGSNVSIKLDNHNNELIFDEDELALVKITKKSFKKEEPVQTNIDSKDVKVGDTIVITGNTNRHELIINQEYVVEKIRLDNTVSGTVCFILKGVKDDWWVKFDEFRIVKRGEVSVEENNEIIEDYRNISNGTIDNTYKSPFAGNITKVKPNLTLNMDKVEEFLKGKNELEEVVKSFDNPLDSQIGGNHYKDMKIQPIEFSMANNLNACQHSVLKYICRYKAKNGKQDLEKAKHFIDLLIKLEYGDNN